MASRCFQDLHVWKKSHDLALQVYQVTQRFPKEEVYGLTSQFRRAAVSIPANIAEGFVKPSEADKLRFYNISQGSLEECRYYILLAKDLGYVPEDVFNCLKNLTNEVSRLLNAYMKGIKNNFSEVQ